MEFGAHFWCGMSRDSSGCVILFNKLARILYQMWTCMHCWLTSTKYRTSKRKHMSHFWMIDSMKFAVARREHTLNIQLYSKLIYKFTTTLKLNYCAQNEGTSKILFGDGEYLHFQWNLHSKKVNTKANPHIHMIHNWPRITSKGVHQHYRNEANRKNSLRQKLQQNEEKNEKKLQIQGKSSN